MNKYVKWTLIAIGVIAVVYAISYYARKSKVDVVVLGERPSTTNTAVEQPADTGTGATTTGMQLAQ